MGKMKMPQFVRIAVQGDCPNSTRMDIRAGRHTMIIDEPSQRHGGDEGMLPLEALMASFASCTHVVANTIARDMEIDFQNISIEADGKFDTRGYTGDANPAPPFPEIDLTIHYSSTATREQLSDLQEQLRWRCPVSALLRAAGVSIHENWIDDDNQ